MKNESIKVNSYVGAIIEQELVTQESDTLVIQLPGGGQTIMAPYLYYPYNIAIELGYDILTIEYGFQKAGVAYNKDDHPELLKECKHTIDRVLEDKDYKNIIFYGKCLGTYVQKEVARFYDQYEVRHVFITPWPTCIPLMKEGASLVVIGTNDGVFLKHHIEAIKGKENIDVFVIPKANHDLDTPDTLESIGYLQKSCVKIHEFMGHCFL